MLLQELRWTLFQSNEHTGTFKNFQFGQKESKFQTLFEIKIFDNAITIQHSSSHLVLPNTALTRQSGYLSDFLGL